MSGILVCSHVCLYEKPSKFRETEMIGDSLAFKCCFYGICLSLQLKTSLALPCIMDASGTLVVSKPSVLPL